MWNGKYFESCSCFCFQNFTCLTHKVIGINDFSKRVGALSHLWVSRHRGLDCGCSECGGWQQACEFTPHCSKIGSRCVGLRFAGLKLNTSMNMMEDIAS